MNHTFSINQPKHIRQCLPCELKLVGGGNGDESSGVSAAAFAAPAGFPAFAGLNRGGSNTN